MGAQQSAAGAGVEAKSGEAAASSSSREQLPLYSYSTISLHSSPGDCWILVHGLVYDVTPFLRAHPGGQAVLLDVAGKDATSEFDSAAHPEYAKEDMAQYLIGRLDKQSAPTQATIEAEAKEEEAAEEHEGKTCVKVKFIYGSQLGQGQRFAERMAEACEATSQHLSKSYLQVSTAPMNTIDPEDLGSEEYVIFIVSTYTNGSPPDNAKFFCEWLTESSVDFRVGEGFMNHVKYAVLGLGNSLYDANYNKVARTMFSQLPTMGGTVLCALGEADESVSRPDVDGTQESDFTKWLDTELLPNLILAIEQPKAFAQKIAIQKSKLRTAARAKARAERKEKDKREAKEYLKNLPDAKDAEEEAAEERKNAAGEDAESDGEGSASEGDAPDSDDGDDAGANEDDAAVDDDGDASDGEKVVDLEELGSVLTKQKASAAAASSSSAAADTKPAPRAMLTDQLRKNLSKQGYKLIGSHSGVKLCRWTKAMLRGRGGCYKHTMYGIISYQCMEMTPSLACANKCVFCIAEGTLVNLADGTSAPIEQLADGLSVLSYDRHTDGLAPLPSQWIKSGEKECIELTFLDGRTLVCTPDHRLLVPGQGWMEAAAIPLQTPVAAGVEYAVDSRSDHSSWRLDLSSSLGLVLDVEKNRAQALSFCRLLGWLLTDGAISSSTHQATLFVGHQLDVVTVSADVALLTSEPVTVTRDTSTFRVVMPTRVADAFRAIGCATGARVDTVTHFPTFLLAPECPTSIVREFLGGLFGGDGITPSLRWRDNVAVGFTSIGFVTARHGAVVAEQRDILQRELMPLLVRCGLSIEGAYWNTAELCEQLSEEGRSAVEEKKQQGQTIAPTITDDADLEADQTYNITCRFPVSALIPFAQLIGFRHCCHKAQRLTAAAAYYRADGRLTVQDAVNRMELAQFFGEEEVDRKTLPLFSIPLVQRKALPGTRRVYDLTVQQPDGSDGSFMANGVVVHNCWRHHTNPVGREWRWQVDEPRMILDNAMLQHKNMINTMRGVPGVVPERLADAQKPRHCALSLVGEPIMYPHINEFVRMLHGEQISSFLVTNAQFPQEVRNMDPVCQLYVSIDAATQESLKAVDRPLFCLAVDTPVLLADGAIVRIDSDSIKVGTRLVGQNAEAVTIIHRDVGHSKMMYKISHASGSHTVTPNHLVTLRWSQNPQFRSFQSPTEEYSRVTITWFDPIRLDRCTVVFRVESGAAAAAAAAASGSVAASMPHAQTPILPLSLGAHAASFSRWWFEQKLASGELITLYRGELFDVAAEKMVTLPPRVLQGATIPLRPTPASNNNNSVDSQVESIAMTEMTPLAAVADDSFSPSTSSGEPSELQNDVNEIESLQVASEELFHDFDLMLDQFARIVGVDLTVAPTACASQMVELSDEVKAFLKAQFRSGATFSKAFVEMREKFDNTAADVMPSTLASVRTYFNELTSNDAVQQQSSEIPRGFKVTDSMFEGFNLSQMEDGDSIETVYMLHHPLIQESFSARQLTTAWRHLNLQAGALKVMLTSLNTANVDSRLSAYDSVCHASMTAALSVKPRSILGFGAHVKARWFTDAVKLPIVASVQVSGDAAHAVSDLTLTLQDGHQVRIRFAPQLDAADSFDELLRVVATAHDARVSDQRMHQLVRQSVHWSGDVAIAEVEAGNFVSIEVDGQEKRFVLGDGTLTHNSDFWERFLACLEAIKHKAQRTVYRMTLVKSFNMQEVIEYAKLVSIGRPTFIEVKGVTYCGRSGAGDITLRDVPLHEEVKSFSEQLCKYLEGNYEMASEHEHSCCVLISDTKMKKDGKWHTWIDYPKFNQLVTEFYSTGKQFSAEDYAAETPEWAVYGAKEAGFSPLEAKKKSKKARPTLAEINAKFGDLNAKNAAAQAASIQGAVVHNPNPTGVQTEPIETAAASSSSSNQ